MNITLLQASLDELYATRLGSYTGCLNLSYPLLPVITEGYLKQRVVIIGQETNTWYRKGDDDLSMCYLQDRHFLDSELKHGEPASQTRYARFVGDVSERYGGNFWRYCRSLYEVEGPLKGPMVNEGKLSHVWLNVFVSEAMRSKRDKGGRPTSNWELQQKLIKLQGSLLLDALRILNPRLIICLSGPNLDYALGCGLGFNEAIEVAPIPLSVVFPEQIGAVRPLTARQLGSTQLQLEPASPPVTLLRAYHPSYFLGRINRYTSKGVLPKGEQRLSGYYTAMLDGAVREAIG